METLTLVALAALGIKIVTVIKSIGKDTNKVVTQILAWVVGVGLVALAAHAKVASDIVVFGSFRLGDLDLSSTILVGMSLISVGSFGYDFTKAVDNTNTMVDPPLMKDGGV